MENENHKSVRDANWHPRQNSEDSQFIPTTEEPRLGLLARVELKQRITILFPPERVDKLIRQEGVNPKDYVNH